MGFFEPASTKPGHTLLQISRQQFGADSTNSLKFIALRVEARGDGTVFFVANL